MGCNGSKKQDVKDSQRTREAPQPTTKNTKEGQAIPGSNRKESVIDIARSPTDMRIEEENFFQEIIERTAHNFIDVSRQPQTLEEQDTETTTKNYSKELDLERVPDSSNIIYMFPTLSKTNGPVTGLMNSSILSIHEQKQVWEILASFIVAQDQIKVKSVGDLVATLPDLPVN